MAKQHRLNLRDKRSFSTKKCRIKNTRRKSHLVAFKFINVRFRFLQLPFTTVTALPVESEENIRIRATTTRIPRENTDGVRVGWKLYILINSRHNQSHPP